MLAVEPGGRGEGDEELGAVGVGAGVGHGEDAGAGVLEARVDLVGELFAVDGGAAAAGAGGVAGLDHEVGDDAVDDGRVVVAALGEGDKVCAGLGGVGGVELEDDGALSWGFWLASRVCAGGVRGSGGTIEVSRDTLVVMIAFFALSRPVFMGQKVGIRDRGVDDILDEAAMQRPATRWKASKQQRLSWDDGGELEPATRLPSKKNKAVTMRDWSRRPG